MTCGSDKPRSIRRQAGSNASASVPAGMQRRDRSSTPAVSGAMARHDRHVVGARKDHFRGLGVEDQDGAGTGELNFRTVLRPPERPLAIDQKCNAFVGLGDESPCPLELRCAFIAGPVRAQARHRPKRRFRLERRVRFGREVDADDVTAENFPPILHALLFGHIACRE